MKNLVLASACFLALTALSGCATIDPDKEFTNADCRAAMLADPTVKQAFANISDSGDGWRDKIAIKREAYNRCLRARGLLRGGGVQPVKPGF